MAESSIVLMLKARDLLATQSHEGLAIMIDQLFMRPETEEYKSSRALYEFCVDKYANCLTLKLLKLFRCSSDDVVRFRSIYLLSQNMAVFRNRKSELSLVSINEMKPLLISCLTMRQDKGYDFNIVRQIVSFVAYNVVKLDNGGWDELNDCILSLAITEPLKAFHVFIDLPPVYGRFIYGFMEKILEKAYQVLLNPKPERARAGDWSLALGTVVKTGIQLLDNSEMMRIDLIKNLISVLVKSATDLVEKGMEQFLVRGLEDLGRFLSRDKYLYDYNRVQCIFVSAFMFKIGELGTHTKEATMKINRALYQPR